MSYFPTSHTVKYCDCEDFPCCGHLDEVSSYGYDDAYYCDVCGTTHMPDAYCNWGSDE